MNNKTKQTAFFVIALFAITASCGKDNPPQANMEKSAAAPADVSAARPEAAPEPPKEIVLNGAGATFPFPIYSQWADTYNKITGVKMNYQSIGSGGGVSQIKAATVDFGASDAPLSADELSAAGLVQFPMIVGGVVLVVNLDGIGAGQLKLTPALVSDIFLGKIKKWNDKAIAKINVDVKLPDSEIGVVHRADGSGTTWIFTNYLSKTVPEWKEKIGANKAVEWPIGMGGKGNEGVAAYVQRVKGAIGYVEFAYAMSNNMSYTLLQNQAGNFVAPTIDAFQAATANANWQQAPGFNVILVDQPGDNSWPITGASFLLIYKEQKDAAKGKAMLKFFDWCYKSGGEAARNLNYVPLPASVAKLVEALWTLDVKSAGQTLWP